MVAAGSGCGRGTRVGYPAGMIRVIPAALVALVAAIGVARADGIDDLMKSAPACDAARAHCVRIRIHVVIESDATVVSPAWFAAQLAAANAHFAAAGIGFEVAGVDALPGSAATIATRADRNALARGRGRRGGKVIHVFLVGTLEDVDVAGQQLNGVA